MKATVCVLIVCSDADFLEGYLNVAASMVGGANVFARRDIVELEEECEAFAADGRFPVSCCLFDGEAIGDAKKLAEFPLLQRAVANATGVVVINAHVAEAFVNEVKQIFPKCQCEDKYIAERAFRKTIIGKISQVTIPEDFKVKRSRKSTLVVSKAPAIKLNGSVDLILDELADRYLEDRDLLLTRFEYRTSNVPLPETISRNVPKLRNIKDAVDELKAYMERTKGTGSGRLVVGEKGVGKTTLTHYAAALVAEKDQYFVFVPVDYQWMPFYEIDNRFEILSEEYLSMLRQEGEPSVSDLSASVINRIEMDKVDDLKMPSIGIRNLLHAMTNDVGFRVGMYCHFNEDVDLEDYVDVYDHKRLEFEAKVSTWLQNLSSEPRRFFLHCLSFGLKREEASFEKFSWERLGASAYRVLCNRKDTHEILQSYIRSSIGVDIGSEGPPFSELLSVLQENKVPLADFNRGLLQGLKKRGYRMVVFIDNIDARYSGIVELLLIRNSLSFMQSLGQMIKHDNVVCVRNRTYASPKFKKLDIAGVMMWPSLQVQPPDLSAVLKRRVDCMRESGECIGRAGWFLTDFLYRWVDHMVGGKWPPTVLEIIEKRHPFNVRGQLNLFSIAARSTVLHHHRLNMMKAHQYTTWGNVTHEFCLRALTWGKERIYSEAGQEFVPNMYDNGHPRSPFNAMTRILLLGLANKRPAFSLKSLVDELEGFGIPRPEVEDAVAKLEAFELIRESYSELKGLYSITKWGEYFFEKVCFRLPYIQAIWWDTHILEGFDLGPPKLLEWNDLRRPAQIFSHWMRMEEALARKEMSVAPEDILGMSIWVHLSEEFAYDLNAIEKAVTYKVD